MSRVETDFGIITVFYTGFRQKQCRAGFAKKQHQFLLRSASNVVPAGMFDKLTSMPIIQFLTEGSLVEI